MGINVFVADVAMAFSMFKACNCFFNQIYILPPSDSPSKTCFVLEIFKFWYFFLFFTFFRFKKTNGSGIINDAMHWHA